MVAYTKQSIGLGGIADDGTGDGFRSGGTKINDNFDVLFNAFTIDSTTFDVTLGETIIISKPGIAASEQLGLSVTQAGDPTRGYKILTNAGSGTFPIGGGLDMVIANNRASGDIFFATNLQTTPTTMLLLSGATNDAIFSSDVDPSVTETQDIGSVTKEWDNIFLQNAPTVSDKRKKNDMGSASSLVPMMKLLDGRIFSRKSKVVKPKKAAETLQRQKIEIVQEQTIEIIDGVPIIKTVDVEKPVIKMVTVKDQDGNSIKDQDGKVVKYPVPVMEDYAVPSEDEIIVSHGRPHTGFMAQDVKQAMTESGIEDWAGYAYHNNEEEDTHVLRLLEFIAPMLAYIQELESRIEKLESI